MLIDIIDRGDLCPLTGVILILVVLGRIFAEDWHKRVGGIMALLAFLGYGGHSLHKSPPKNAEALFAISLRSLIVFGLVLGLAWVVLPLVFVGLSIVARRIKAWSEATSAEYHRLEEAWAAENRRHQEQEVWRHGAPDRERAQEEAEAQAKIAVEAKRRREDAVAAAEVKFALHQHELGEKFTLQMLQDFIKKYMGDDRDPQYTEERSRQLQDIIAQLVAKTSLPRLPSTLPDLEQWFQDQKRTIEESGLNATDKKIKLLHLEKRYDDLVTRLIHGA